MEDGMQRDAIIDGPVARREADASRARGRVADAHYHDGEGPAVGTASTWSRFLRAATGKDALAIVDQAFVSGTRFLTAVIVGRVCGPHELGDYTLGFTLYCLAACILTNLIGFPFTVYSHQMLGESRRRYAGSVLIHFVVFDVVVVVLLGLSAGALATSGWRPELAQFVAVLAIAFPAALAVEFTRRLALARLEVGAALLTDAAMAVIQVGGMLGLAAAGMLGAATTFVATGVAGAIAGLGWFAIARGNFVIHWPQVWPDFLKNWKFGRWSLASQLVLVARSTAVLWLLALLLDPSSTGIFVAGDNLVRLSAPLMMAVTNVYFPRAARVVASGDLPGVRRLAGRSAVILAVATAVLALFFVVAGERVLGFLYGGAYGGQGLVIALLAIAMVADALETVATNGLMAIDRSQIIFAANLAGTVLTLAIAAVLIPSIGIVGAAWGSLLGRCVTSAVLWAMLFKHTLTGATAEGGA
jgi:O-antigen/teichoic acid export membrane protein